MWIWVIGVFAVLATVAAVVFAVFYLRRTPAPKSPETAPTPAAKSRIIVPPLTIAAPAPEVNSREFVAPPEEPKFTGPRVSEDAGFGRVIRGDVIESDSFTYFGEEAVPGRAVAGLSAVGESLIDRESGAVLATHPNLIRPLSETLYLCSDGLWRLGDSAPLVRARALDAVLNGGSVEILTETSAISYDLESGQSTEMASRGKSISAFGSTVVVGSPRENRVRVGGQTIYGADIGLSSDAQFGAAVHLTPDSLIVGAPGARAVFVFSRVSDSFVVDRRYIFTEESAGSAVGVYDGGILVGAPDAQTVIYK
jgi:hypothetical protein